MKKILVVLGTMLFLLMFGIVYTYCDITPTELHIERCEDDYCTASISLPRGKYDIPSDAATWYQEDGYILLAVGERTIGPMWLRFNRGDDGRPLFQVRVIEVYQGDFLVRRLEVRRSRGSSWAAVWRPAIF